MRKVSWFVGSLSSGILAIASPAWTQDLMQTAPLPSLIEATEDEPMRRINSVSELSDVRPTDWAYQALKSLVERYGVISGYPDGTFRGNRSLTRNEFAAVLNEVLGRVETQILSDRVNNTLSQDVLTIRRLINFYGEALSELRTRLDQITSRTDQLERQQFSTTTKLSGQTDFIVTNGTDADATLLSRVRLNLFTSFQGTDRLVIQLEAGNNGRDAISAAHNSEGTANARDQRQNLLGTTGVLADGGGLDAVGATSDLKIRKLYYAFRPFENLEVAVGSRIPPSDFIDRNSFANQSGENFSSSFFANNPLIVQNEIDRFGGAGAAIAWNALDNLTVRALFAGADAADPSNGVFRDRYQASVEAEYTIPNQPITVRLQYTNAGINGSEINAAGINAEWAIRRRFGVFGIFGRLGFGSYRGFNTVLGEDLDLDPKTWAVGVSFQNFLIPGSKAGLAIGQPFVTSDLGNATQTNFEAFFGLLLNDRLNLSPSFLVVSNPNNRASPTIWQWSIRVLYSF